MTPFYVIIRGNINEFFKFRIAELKTIKNIDNDLANLTYTGTSSIHES